MTHVECMPELGEGKRQERDGHHRAPVETEPQLRDRQRAEDGRSQG